MLHPVLVVALGEILARMRAARFLAVLGGDDGGGGLAEQIVELGRNREEIKRLSAERDEGSVALGVLDAQGAEHKGELRRTQEQLQQTTGQLGEANRALEAARQELARLNGLYEEATFAASGRQIDLVARESEVEKLTDDLTRLKREWRDFDRSLDAADQERQSAVDALAAEKQRAAETASRESRDAARMLTQVEKIYRLRQLARLEQALARYGSATERSRYGELVQCESGHLSP